MSDPKKARQLFRNARREALLVLTVFTLALVWTVGYCYLHGYYYRPEDPHRPEYHRWLVEAELASERTPENFQQILGLPDWVFIGILLPWLMCGAFTFGFCIGMTDDDLGEEAQEAPTAGTNDVER